MASADRSLIQGQEATNKRKAPRRRVSKGPEAGARRGTVDGGGGAAARAVTPATDTTGASVSSGTQRTNPEHLNKAAWSKKVLTLSAKTLSEEFQRNIKKFVDVRCTTICSAKNEDKNRYADVLCLDDTRVVLKTRKAEDDYIHANWVKNPDGSRYICTQGPLTETIEDFWLMVVKERVSVILMLCQFYEGEDNEKCAIYFPTNEGETRAFGPFSVKCLAILDKPAIDGCVCSNLEIT